MGPLNFIGQAKCPESNACTPQELRIQFLEMEVIRLNCELKEANEKISSLISAIENISRHFQ